MHSSNILTLALLFTPSSAHGVITMIRGANGVNMPGLSVTDGTPRTCSTNRCGSQADTAIIRDREIRSGEVGPLGRTQGNGAIDAATMVATFMGGGGGAVSQGNKTNEGASAGVGVEDEINLGALRGGRGNTKRELRVRQFLKGLLGGLGRGGGGGGGTDSQEAVEGNVQALAGAGADSGLPTCADDGTVEMVFHQINQDGAGPLDAVIDGTSGGTDASAFQRAEVTQDVPGLGFQGLSLATSKDFPLTVQMPAGMTCDATVAGVDNVCIVRVRNGAAAGPFGGSAAFTQSSAARKRAVAYRLKKRGQTFRA